MERAVSNGDIRPVNEIIPDDFEVIEDDNPEEIVHEEENLSEEEVVLEEIEEEEEEDNVNVIIGNNAGVRHADVLELDNGNLINDDLNHHSDEDEAGLHAGDIDVHNVIVNGVADEVQHNLGHNYGNNVDENVVVDEAGHNPGGIDVHIVFVNGVADEVQQNLGHNDGGNVAENVVVDEAGDIDVHNVIVNGVVDEVQHNLGHDENNVDGNIVVDEAGLNMGDIDVHNVIVNNVVDEVEQNLGHNDGGNVAENVVLDEAGLDLGDIDVHNVIVNGVVDEVQHNLGHDDENNHVENGVVVEAVNNPRANVILNANPVINGFPPEEQDTMVRRIEMLVAQEPANEMTILDVNHCHSLHIDGLTNAFVNLRHLSMSHVGLLSLANFPELPNLIKLDVSHNAIINGLEVLRNAPLLRYIDLTNNPIREFDTLLPLRHFNNLWYLELKEVQIPNILERRLDVFNAIPILVALNKFDRNLREISILQIQRDCAIVPVED